MASVSAASYDGSALAPESIVAAFGLNLANATEQAVTQPLPTRLAGIEVRVTDSLNVERKAPLFFVSPVQINYQIPPGVAAGDAVISTTNPQGETSIGTAMISQVAPGVFAANANGRGVAAAVMLRAKPDGSQSYEPVVQFDPVENRFISKEIDPGPQTDQVFLVLFGTGLRFHAGLSNVSAKIGSAEVPVTYAGPQREITGLDQVNILVPHTLAGLGNTQVTLIVDERPANRVEINLGGQVIEAYFMFHYPPMPETFVVRLTDPEKIGHARDLISGKTTRPASLGGVIIKSPAPYNPPWSFHLDPPTIGFFDVAIEVCDSSIRLIEEHLDEVGGAFLPGNRWCPWGSRLIREVVFVE